MDTSVYAPARPAAAPLHRAQPGHPASQPRCRHPDGWNRPAGPRRARRRDLALHITGTTEASFCPHRCPRRAPRQGPWPACLRPPSASERHHALDQLAAGRAPRSAAPAPAPAPHGRLQAHPPAGAGAARGAFRVEKHSSGSAPRPFLGGARAGSLLHRRASIAVPRPPPLEQPLPTPHSPTLAPPLVLPSPPRPWAVATRATPGAT
jgi:hypothetical protein